MNRKPMNDRDPHRRMGSTLLISMWALLLLSAVILTWARSIDQELEKTFRTNQALEAKARAYSGIAVALHPLVTNQTAALEDHDEMGNSYRVRVVHEGGKLNISYLIYGEDQRRLAILRAYLLKKELKPEQVDRFVDCLLDWVGPPGIKRLNGAQEDANYRPSHKPLASLEEIPLIKGSEPIVADPEWRENFTLLSRGPIDLRWAPAEILAILPGVGDARAENFVTLRKGQDGVEDTVDDVRYNSADEALMAMGLSDLERQNIADLVTWDDPTVQIISEGTSGDVTRKVEVIARRPEGQSYEILLWTENAPQ